MEPDLLNLEEYLEERIKSGDIDMAILAVKDIIEAEKRKFSDRLDDLEKRVAALEQIQVTRREFEELKKRVEELEQISITEVIVRI